jgi:hypothetical protein
LSEPRTWKLRRPRYPGPIFFALVSAFALVSQGCSRDAPPQLQPDQVLRDELGLTDRDEVHRILLTAGAAEETAPDSVTVPPGAWVEFVTGDWRVHEVRFLSDSLDAPARAFLEGTDQLASPPLVDRDARFVVFFGDAPPGRYPFVVEGNGSPAHGVVVVLSRP